MGILKPKDIKIVENINNILKNPEEEWIWVEGYKGTDSNMVCKGYQYEIGKSFVLDEKVILWVSGFHFCEDIKDVFNYYFPDGKNRFFKVEGLVRKSEYKKMLGNLNKNDRFNDSILVAKEIKFLNECLFDDIKESFFEKIPFIETEEEYKSFSFNKYNKFAMEKFIKKMNSMGIGEIFANSLIEKAEYINDLFEILNYAAVLYSENISKDMLIYLLLQRVEKRFN